MSDPVPARTVIFALGANLGDPLAALRRAAGSLAAVLSGPRVSGVYRTPPEGGAVQPDYLNAVLAGEAAMTPDAALELAGRIEREAGRVRTTPGAARVLDVDVLFVGGEVVDRPELRVPHPRWSKRDFVVVPLLDLCPGWRDPESGRTVAEVAGAAGWDRRRFIPVLEPGALLSREVA